MSIESIVEYAKKYLERCIIKGRLLPGQQIKEEGIASKLKISRPPIREAFKMLEGEGLIHRKARKGVFVSEITYKDIWELYTLKMALYGIVSNFAIDKISEREISDLKKIVQKMEECVEKKHPDIIKYQILNDKFHIKIIDIIGHTRIKKIILCLNNQLHRFSYKSLTERSHLLSSYQYHRKILEAMENKNKDLAERLTREHITKGLEVLQRVLKKEGGHHAVISPFQSWDGNFTRAQ